MYYMTNYATKDDIKLHQVVMLAAVLRLSLEHTESEGQIQQPQQASQVPQAQRVDWSKFALRLYNRFAREREISGVAIANHILQQPAFFCHLESKEKSISTCSGSGLRFHVLHASRRTLSYQRVSTKPASISIARLQQPTASPLQYMTSTGIEAQS
jgi:hypothetical protein